MSSPDHREPWHGTLNGYNNRRCRCKKCRAAWAAYMRNYKAERRAEALARRVN